MIEPRKPAHDVTPDHEDRGIFKGQIVQLTADLVPVYGQNGREDIMIKGFVSAGRPIDVVFAGRRRHQAVALLNRLKAVWAQKARNGAKPAADSVRFPVAIEGAWRPRFACDDQGWQTREMQFFAARWAVLDSDGNSVTFGAPVIR